MLPTPDVSAVADFEANAFSPGQTKLVKLSYSIVVNPPLMIHIVVGPCLCISAEAKDSLVGIPRVGREARDEL